MTRTIGRTVASQVNSRTTCPDRQICTYLPSTLYGSWPCAGGARP